MRTSSFSECPLFLVCYHLAQSIISLVYDLPYQSRVPSVVYFDCHHLGVFWTIFGYTGQDTGSILFLDSISQGKRIARVL